MVIGVIVCWWSRRCLPPTSGPNIFTQSPLHLMLLPPGVQQIRVRGIIVQLLEEIATNTVHGGNVLLPGRLHRGTNAEQPAL